MAGKPAHRIGVTLFFITHDRSFLDRVCTRIVELDRGKLASFPGSFTQYQQRKEAMLHEEALANARADKLLKEEEVWIRKGVEARRTRAVFRVQRLDKLPRRTPGPARAHGQGQSATRFRRQERQAGRRTGTCRQMLR